jgi:hypothetical protein
MKTKRPGAADVKCRESEPGLTFAEYVSLCELLRKLLGRDAGAWGVSVVANIKRDDECPRVVMMTTRYADGLLRMEDVRYSPQGDSDD